MSNKVLEMVNLVPIIVLFFLSINSIYQLLLSVTVCKAMTALFRLFESDFYHVTGEMGPDFSSKTPVKSLTSQQIVRIHQLFRQAKFDDPSGDVRRSNCLIDLKKLHYLPYEFIVGYYFLCSE